MNTDEELQALLNETLRKMGRNLLNYQTVERIWKFQYKNSELEIIIENGETKTIRNPEVRPKTPMGDLSRHHTKAIFSSPTERDTKEDIRNISIKTSLRVGEDGELTEERKKQVLSLVEERNKLVHCISEKFNPDTGAGCQEVCDLLDEQNAKILEEIEFLNSISSVRRELMVELQKYFESEEFNSEIEKLFPKSR